MNLKQALAQARSVLQDNRIEEAVLEGEILLKHVLGVSRADLYSNLDEELDRAKEHILGKLLERRLAGEPSAYITGHKEFYGLDFVVNSNVLIPRPETELLVEKTIVLVQKRNIETIADIGTGCGAIAVSIAVNLRGVKLYATDVSTPALEVANANCRKQDVTERITLIQGNMLEPLPSKVDLIVANLPYVKTADIPQEGPLSFEPVEALNGGVDGLDYIKILVCQAENRLKDKGCMLLEVGSSQSNIVRSMLQQVFPGSIINSYRDLAGIERVVSLCLT